MRFNTDEAERLRPSCPCASPPLAFPLTAVEPQAGTRAPRAFAFAAPGERRAAPRGRPVVPAPRVPVPVPVAPAEGPRLSLLPPQSPAAALPGAASAVTASAPL